MVRNPDQDSGAVDSHSSAVETIEQQIAAQPLRIAQRQAPGKAGQEDVYVPSEVNAPESHAYQTVTDDFHTDTEESPFREEPQPLSETGPERGADLRSDNEKLNELATEVRTRKRRMSLYAGGDVSTNGNPASGFAGGPKRSQGQGAKTEGIKEVSEESTYGVPVSFGLGLKYSFTERLSLGAGLNYSLLTRSFSGIYTDANGASFSGDIYNHMHYIGIPVNLYFNVINHNDLKCYTYAGGTVEKNLSNRYRIETETGNLYYREHVDGVQVSAGLGFGVEFRIAGRFGLYVDPSFRYYFDCGQPKSIRTQKPLMLNFEVGMRWGF